MTKNVISTPVEQDGVVWLMSGLRGSMLQAVRLAGAKGDISDSKNLLWSHNRQTSYVPSALLYDDRLWFLRVGSESIRHLNINKIGICDFERPQPGSPPARIVTSLRGNRCAVKG